MSEHQRISMSQKTANGASEKPRDGADRKGEALTASAEGAVLPRAVADVVNEGLSQHGNDEEPVSRVTVITLDRKEIEAVEREFGGQRIHAKEVPFDLFAAPSSTPSPISGSAQPANQPDALTGPKPD